MMEKDEQKECGPTASPIPGYLLYAEHKKDCVVPAGQKYAVYNSHNTSAGCPVCQMTATKTSAGMGK